MTSQWILWHFDESVKLNLYSTNDDVVREATLEGTFVITGK